MSAAVENRGPGLRGAEDEWVNERGYSNLVELRETLPRRFEGAAPMCVGL